MAAEGELTADRHRSGWACHRVTLGVVLAGLLLTGLLSLGAARIHDSNEDRLLRQRGRESAAVVASNISTVRAPLVSAADLAEATPGDFDLAENQLTELVTRGERFVSATIWSTDATSLEPLLVVGDAPTLTGESPEQIRAVLDRSIAAEGLAVFDLTDLATPALGYSAVSSTDDPRYLVYVERVLPENRTALRRPQDVFSGLENALYLGTDETASRLLTASTADLPLRGRTHYETVPLGDTTVRLVVSPRGDLGGALMGRLWWLLLAAGAAVTAATGALVERLLRRRDEAAALAIENRRLFAEQRNVAQTLQRSLLPQILPRIGELNFATVYEPASTEGADIGGDWYDAIEVDDDHVVFAVGDVSGRGLEAATIMASMRYAIRAFALQGLSPSQILYELGTLLDVQIDRHFATVICGKVDTNRHEVSFANAGHPQPLLIDGDSATFATVHVGPPVGVARHQNYETFTMDFPEHMTIVAYTDGLFERRGENIDAGLERLRTAASGTAVAEPADLPGDVLDVIRGRMGTDVAQDDTAMLGVTWST